MNLSFSFCQSPQFFAGKMNSSKCASLSVPYFESRCNLHQLIFDTGWEDPQFTNHVWNIPHIKKNFEFSAFFIGCFRFDWFIITISHLCSWSSMFWWLWWCFWTAGVMQAWFVLCKLFYVVSFCFSWNEEKTFIQELTMVRWTFSIPEVVGKACLRLSLGVHLLILLCQSVGLVRIALGMLSVEEHEHTDDLLSGVYKDNSLQETQCKCCKFCMWNFD